MTTGTLIATGILYLGLLFMGYLITSEINTQKRRVEYPISRSLRNAYNFIIVGYWIVIFLSVAFIWWM